MKSSGVMNGDDFAMKTVSLEVLGLSFIFTLVTKRDIMLAGSILKMKIVLIGYVRNYLALTHFNFLFCYIFFCELS
jgi:hypothetical protein